MIVTLTMNPTVDKSSSVSQVVPERKLRCEPPRFEPGGGGLNVSRVVQRLGGKTKALYPAGGSIGELLHQLLEEEKIDRKSIPIKNMTRENLIIYEENSGQQFRFGMPGPRLSKEECERCLKEIEALSGDVKYLVASGSLPPEVPDDFYARVAEVAHKKGIRIIVDTSGEALRLAAQEGVFLLKPNLRELSLLAGKDEIESEEEQEETARQLISEGATEVVVVSLGKAGVLLVTKDESTRIPSPQVRVRSKVGAGDSQVGGIVHALTNGNSFHDAVLYGVAAGAAAVMTEGTELCRKKDVERLYDRLKRRCG